MKATDLMIGDWANYQPGDTPQYMKVGMVSGYDVQLDLYREGGIEVAAQVWFDEEAYIQPIPLTPQPRWKPSEEQLNFFKRAVNGCDIPCRGQVALESLYNDLKKLM